MCRVSLWWIFYTLPFNTYPKCVSNLISWKGIVTKWILGKVLAVKSFLSGYFPKLLRPTYAPHLSHLAIGQLGQLRQELCTTWCRTWMMIRIPQATFWDFHSAQRQCHNTRSKSLQPRDSDHSRNHPREITERMLLNWQITLEVLSLLGDA